MTTEANVEGAGRSVIVSLKNVRKSYEHEGKTLEVLRGIDLTIRSGEMVCLWGPSGAGKSTLLHLIGTLDMPTAGTVELDGNLVTALSSSRVAALRNRAIGFVFQFHHLLPEFNALENVMMPGLIQGRPRKELENQAMALLTEVGLEKRASHRPGELSGGEQQRVALARALVLEPKLLLADEPTGNLDSRTSDQIHELFFSINKTRGTTIVVVTHNMALADSMPRKVTLRDGRVLHDERRESGPYRNDSGPAATSEA